MALWKAGASRSKFQYPPEHPLNMEEYPQIRRFDGIPSSEEFSSQFEKKNVPAVFTGCVKHWRAISKWNVSEGGLDYLQDLAGSTLVEAMLSRSAPVFYGDIRSHERVPLPFSTFIGYCKNLLQRRDDVQDSLSQLKTQELEGAASQHENSLICEEVPQQVYLAQIPIANAESEEKVQLACLREDIEMPAFLESKILASVNLWMNNAGTRSSTHYDPHHNLLCIVTGCKQVVLWPPSATPFLYPLPLYGEASNHSAISLDSPNFGLYPRAKCRDQYSQKVVLNAGDALFIPEGWFHQVDSEITTIAVNFWWQSDMICGMLDHMDGYYLRRILKRLTDKEMDQALYMPSNKIPKSVERNVFNARDLSGHSTTDYCDKNLEGNHEIVSLKGKKPEQSFTLHDLDPQSLGSLQHLVSLIHVCVNQGQLVGNGSEDHTLHGEADEDKKIDKANFFNLESDPIANTVWNLDPLTFRSVFLTMAHNFPRTLEACILHALSPVGAEVFTRKFEQMDQLIVEHDRSQFYQKFYSVFDNQFSAMNAILDGKESFAQQAFKNVLVQYLGINFDGSKPLFE